MKTLKNILIALLLICLSLSVFSCADKEDEIGTEKTFTFEIYLKGESSPKSTYSVTTTKATVGEALLERGLIQGDNGPYGLYVKTVDGIFAEYETTGTYWAFYINGNLSPSGVDTTKIKDGETYSFRLE